MEVEQSGYITRIHRVYRADKSIVHDQPLWLSLVKKNYFST